MSGSTAAAKTRPELVERIGDLARETGSTPEELEAAAREWAAHERWKAAMVREALDDEAAGDRGRPAGEVFDEVEALLEERIRAARP
jgi:hypothetical protein